MRSCVPLCVAVLLTIPHPAVAQDSLVAPLGTRAVTPVQRGEKVRLTLLSGRHHVGVFEASNPAWVTLITSPGQRVRTVERRMVVRVERWIAPSSVVAVTTAHVGGGAAKGLAIGAMIGGVVGLVGGSGDSFIGPGGAAVLGAGLFGLIGLVIGMLGSAQTATDSSWEVVPDSAARQILLTPPPG